MTRKKNTREAILASLANYSISAPAPAPVRVAEAPVIGNPISADMGKPPVAEVPSDPAPIREQAPPVVALAQEAQAETPPPVAAIEEEAPSRKPLDLSQMGLETLLALAVFLPAVMAARSEAERHRRELTASLEEDGADRLLVLSLGGKA